MKKTLNCVVRIENDQPIIFMPVDDDTINNKNLVECFTFRDGHNEASVHYMRTLPLASDEVAQQTLKNYQNYLDSLPITKIELKKIKRLKMK